MRVVLNFLVIVVALAGRTSFPDIDKSNMNDDEKEGFRSRVEGMVTHSDGSELTDCNLEKEERVVVYHVSEIVMCCVSICHDLSLTKPLGQ